MSHHSRPAPFGKYMGTNLLGGATICARATRGISDSKTGNARATPAPRNTLRLEIVFFICDAPCPKRPYPRSWVPTTLAERVATNELLDEVPKSKAIGLPSVDHLGDVVAVTVCNGPPDGERKELLGGAGQETRILRKKLGQALHPVEGTIGGQDALRIDRRSVGVGVAISPDAVEMFQAETHGVEKLVARGACWRAAVKLQELADRLGRHWIVQRRRREVWGQLQREALKRVQNPLAPDGGSRAVRSRRMRQESGQAQEACAVVRRILDFDHPGS